MRRGGVREREEGATQRRQVHVHDQRPSSTTTTHPPGKKAQSNTRQLLIKHDTLNTVEQETMGPL